MTRYWLMKSEPEEFSIEALKRVRYEPWSGVRNFTARNYMMEMNVGDLILFYHSSCPVPGVYGLAKVSKKAEVDVSQFDTRSKYHDPKATRAKPYWYGVTVRYVKTFSAPVTLEEIKVDKKLTGMLVLARPRLSVSPVSKAEFEHILTLAKG